MITSKIAVLFTIDSLFAPYTQKSDGKQENDQAGVQPVAKQDSAGESSPNGYVGPESEVHNPKVYEAESGKPTRAEQIVAHEFNRLNFQPIFIKIHVINPT